MKTTALRTVNCTGLSELPRDRWFRKDQLSALRILADQSGVQTRAVEYANRATILSESRYRSGLGSQLEVLDARRTELRNQRQALQVRAAQYQATVGLVRALGGGWES